MQRRAAISAISFLALFMLPATVISGKKMAMVDCQATGEKLVYECVITLTDKTTGAPVLDGEFLVSADMPSMTGVHNIEPVLAHHQHRGMYRARIELEMYGEWILMMDLVKPERDRIVKKLIFGKEGSNVSTVVDKTVTMSHKHGEKDADQHD
ncbi:MAG: FixH family protein [Pirellulaceae bacterium]|jgi:hypothetical protein